VDINQADIVKELRDYGCSVECIHTLRNGIPDLLIGIEGHRGNGYNYLMEIKDPDKPPSKRKLTEDEEKWHSAWKGQVHIIHTAEEAIKIITDHQLSLL